jgi:outer membrane protein assembly factor BamB
LKTFLYKYSLPILVILGLVILGWWFLFNPVSNFTRSIPGMDNRGKGAGGKAEDIHIGESFSFFKDIATSEGPRWPRFRGAGFDNINKEKIPLLDKWGSSGPKILWKVQLGEGHAAPSVFDGRVYLLDYDEAKHADELRCFSLTTGEELWRRWYKVHLKRNHGLSRTIPAVDDRFVLTIGPRCHVMCADRINGNLFWTLDLEKEYSTEAPFWYTGQCPLLDNDTAIIATGGKALMIAVDCKTGKKAWESPNPHSWKMSHSSVMPMVFQGKKMYVYAAIGGVCGVSAQGPDRGRVLWETTEFSPSVVAPSPVILDNGKIFLAAGYGAGSALLQLKTENGHYTADVIQKYKPLDGIASEQQTPVLYNGYIYAILPKDAGEFRDQFVCCREDDCRKIVMNSGKTHRFGLGPYILADGKFYILNDDGEMTIARASPSGFTVLDKARIIEGQDAWGPVAIAGGYLLMRDMRQLVCLDIRK